MKRGLISWDRDELPVAAFDARLSALYRLCADFDVPALVAYSDVCRSNDVRYISNYMPYWNRALTVVPRGEKPILLCALSPRVYPWIKSVTVHETILPSPSLPGQLVKLCAEKGWSRLGVLDRAGLPNDLYTQLGAEKLVFVECPRLKISQMMAIKKVRFLQNNDQGTISTLEVVDPGALGGKGGSNDNWETSSEEDTSATE